MPFSKELLQVDLDTTLRVPLVSSCRATRGYITKLLNTRRSRHDTLDGPDCTYLSLQSKISTFKRRFQSPLHSLSDVIVTGGQLGAGSSLMQSDLQTTVQLSSGLMRLTVKNGSLSENKSFLSKLEPLHNKSSFFNLAI